MAERREKGGASVRPRSIRLSRHVRPARYTLALELDPQRSRKFTGKLAIDERFKDAGASGSGVSLTGKAWPHGFKGEAKPHGTVFSRR